MKTSIFLGGGCFWCLEAIYQRIRGVIQVTNGYAGGEVDNPSYEEVSGGTTGHAEIVKIDFDPKAITYEKLLEIFWHIHDPTTQDRQGQDVGPQYRSIILYTDEAQKAAAEKSLKEIGQPLWPNPNVTQIEKLTKFYPAEAYHQNYFNTHPEAAYCQVVINPKLAKFNQNFTQLLNS